MISCVHYYTHTHTHTHTHTRTHIHTPNLRHTNAIYTCLNISKRDTSQCCLTQKIYVYMCLCLNIPKQDTSECCSTQWTHRHTRTLFGGTYTMYVCLIFRNEILVNAAQLLTLEHTHTHAQFRTCTWCICVSIFRNETLRNVAQLNKLL